MKQYLETADFLKIILLWSSNMRVVASLTTMPDKYPRTVKTLESLNKQSVKLDAIYLGLPKKSRRLEIDYPPLPKEALELCEVIEVVDFGPITKILAGLIKEQDPETIIITFDDDMVYPPDMVKKLLEKHKEYPNSAISSSGMLFSKNCPMCGMFPNEDYFPFAAIKPYIPPEGRKVDAVHGFPGALYVRKFFPSNERLEKEFLNYALIDNNMLMNDDIVISGFLSLKGIERRIFSGMPEVKYVRNKEGKWERVDTEISKNFIKFFQRMNLAIDKSKSLGMYSKTESISFSETFLGILLWLIFIVALIILLTVWSIKTNEITPIFW